MLAFQAKFVLFILKTKFGIPFLGRFCLLRAIVVCSSTTKAIFKQWLNHKTQNLPCYSNIETARIFTDYTYLAWNDEFESHWNNNNMSSWYFDRIECKKCIAQSRRKRERICICVCIHRSHMKRWAKMRKPYVSVCVDISYLYIDFFLFSSSVVKFVVATHVPSSSRPTSHIYIRSGMKNKLMIIIVIIVVVVMTKCWDFRQKYCNIYMSIIIFRAVLCIKVVDDDVTYVYIFIIIIMLLFYVSLVLFCQAALGCTAFIVVVTYFSHFVVAPHSSFHRHQLLLHNNTRIYIYIWMNKTFLDTIFLNTSNKYDDNNTSSWRFIIIVVAQTKMTTKTTENDWKKFLFEVRFVGC